MTAGYTDPEGNAMTYRGHIKGGVVVLDEPVELPEGTEVRVEPATQGRTEPTLADDLREFIGCVEDLPPDVARNHDHYLYGAPKR